MFTFYWCLRGAVLVLVSFWLIAGRRCGTGGRLILFSRFALLVRRSSRGGGGGGGAVRRLRLRGENSLNCLPSSETAIFDKEIQVEGLDIVQVYREKI